MPAFAVRQQRRFGSGRQRSDQPFSGDCHFCGVRGHRQRECPEAKRASAEVKARRGGGSGASKQGFMVRATGLHAASSAAALPAGVVEFCVDSGATAHIAADASLFVGLSPTTTAVQLANGGTATALGIGVVPLSAMTGRRTPMEIDLHETLHLPGSVNLLSVARLAAACQDCALPAHFVCVCYCMFVLARFSLCSGFPLACLCVLHPVCSRAVWHVRDCSRTFHDCACLLPIAFLVRTGMFETFLEHSLCATISSSLFQIKVTSTSELVLCECAR